MNRNEEYKALLAQLDETPPALEYTVPRAKARLRRRHRVLRPLGSLAGFFACFVLLVNVCTPVAYACSGIPVLRELAAAVIFSPSLSAAVKNEYVQPLDLEQTKNGITVNVDYLIVDQKQVNIFYRADSDDYEALYEEPKLARPDGGELTGVSYGLREFDVKNGKLRCLTVDFLDEDVLPGLELTLLVRDDTLASWAPAEASPGDSAFDLLEEPEELPSLAEFTFTLEFDPAFTAVGRRYQVNEPLTLDGQTLTVTELEVYPTHLRMNIEADEANTAWPWDIDFSIRLANGRTLDTITNGITATGEGPSLYMNSFRAESPYFERASELTIQVDSVRWMGKTDRVSHLDLTTGEIDYLPEGVEFYEANRRGNDWEVTFLVEAPEKNHFFSVWEEPFLDPEGGEHYSRIQSSQNHTAEKPAGSYGPDEDPLYPVEGVFEDTFYLEDYPFDQVTLHPLFSHIWESTGPVSLTVPLQ